MVDADIVLVGELHTHPAVHLLQARMLAGLAADGRPLVLSMEQFSRADQPVLDAYLAGRIGEAALIRDGNAWPNYQSDYRPLVEFAKAHHLPVIAANAPKPLVSCVGQEGPAWLDQLPASRRSQLARTLTLGDDPIARSSWPRSIMAMPTATPAALPPRPAGTTPWPRAWWITCAATRANASCTSPATST